MRSPVSVPPGSRTSTASSPSDLARSLAWVVFPEPSIPSREMNIATQANRRDRYVPAVPDSPRATGRTLRLIPIALFLTAVTLAGCGSRIPDISVPSIHALSSAGAGGSASFNIDGSTFTVAQSGTIQTSFPGAKQISYSGPLGCKGHYFNASYTEDIDFYFHYFKKDAYLLIDNGGETPLPLP